MNQNHDKLAIVLGNYYGQIMGGAELQVYYLIQEILKRKFILHYCFLSNGSPYAPNSGIVLHPIKCSKILKRFGNIKYPYSYTLLKCLHTIKPKIIYQRSGFSFAAVSAYYAKTNNCKFIFHVAQEKDVQYMNTTWFRPWLIPEQKLTEYGIKNADAIIVQTKFQAEQIKKKFGRESLMVSNGHPVPNVIEKVNNVIVVLWIGNWKPVKRPELFIELAKRIGVTSKLRFVMVGRSRSANYKKLIEDAKKVGVEVTGEIENAQVNSLLDKSHLLVNTSIQEGFSNTFIQAWMRKVPVISLNVNPDNVINDKKIGCFSGNFEELVKDTKNLILNDRLRQAMGENARKYSINNHSLKNFEKIIDLIKTIS